MMGNTHCDSTMLIAFSFAKSEQTAVSLRCGFIEEFVMGEKVQHILL